MRVTEDASTRGLKSDVDDMIVKMAGQHQTKLLHIKQKLATIDHTPDHPVYPVMIQEAIDDLNEGGGSTKDAISHFIMRKYDVFRVVHPAKLIEQLEKLVEKEEIVCTPENRYMLPTEDTGSPANLKQGKKQSVQCEQDWRSNKLHKVKDRVEIPEDQDAIIAKEDQPEIDKVKEPQAVQGEHVECQKHLQDQVRVYEEERFKTTAEQISQVFGRSKVIEEERYQQPAKGVDEGKHDKEARTQLSETEATEEQIQLQRQKLQVTEDEVEAETESKVTEDLHKVEPAEGEEIKDETQPQVPQDLQVEELLQFEKTQVTSTGKQIETQGKEVEVTGDKKALQEQDNEVGNNATEISHTLEFYTEKPDQDKGMISMPSSSQTSQQLDHAGTSLLLHTMKEKCINAWKKLTEAEHELMEIFSCLNSMEVLANRESQTKAFPHSDYVLTDSMLIAQHQQNELPKLKRTAELEITALQESFQNQKRKSFPGNHEGALKYQPESISFSPALLNMESQQHEAEKHQDFPGFKGRLEPCGPEKLSKSCPVAGSNSHAYMDAQGLNLEQQSEHHRTIIGDLQTPVNLEHFKLEQQSGVPGLKMALEKSSSIVEEELTSTEDITIDTDQVEPERPPGFELTVEQLSQKRLQCAVPCGDAKKLDSVLVKEQKLEVSIKERHIDVEMTTLEQPCQIKHQMQEKELRPQDERASKSKSGAARVIYDQQLHNIKMLQDPNQILLLDESSRSMNQHKKGPGKRKKVKVELLRRELRPRGPKASASNPAQSTDANDLDQTLSSINLDRQQKLDHQIPERSQEKKPKKVEKSSQSVEQELKDRSKKKHLRSQLAPIIFDEVQMLERPGQCEPKTAGEFIQAQQQQPQQRRLQSRVQCSFQTEQTMDKTMEEMPPLPNQNEQESQLAYQHRGRPPKLKPDMDEAKGKILSVDDQDHHKELPSRMEGQRSKTKTSAELTVGELSSSHQTRVEQQPKKRGRGRPPKLISAAPQTVNIPLPPLDQLKQKRQQHDHQQKQKWPNGELKGGLQDPIGHQLQKLAISSLPSQNQKQQQHTPYSRREASEAKK